MTPDQFRAVRDVRVELQLTENQVALVGSQWICGDGNDYDVLVWGRCPQDVVETGYEYDRPDTDGEYRNADLMSFRKGDTNVLLATSREVFAAEYTAACAAKWIFQNNPRGLDMSLRKNRIDIHSALRAQLKRYVTDDT